MFLFVEDLPRRWYESAGCNRGGQKCQQDNRNPPSCIVEFDGTGFVAKTVTHLLFDCDRDAKLFGMRNDDYSTPAWVPMLAKS